MASYGMDYWEISEFLDISESTMRRYFRDTEWPELMTWRNEESYAP